MLRLCALLLLLGSCNILCRLACTSLLLLSVLDCHQSAYDRLWMMLRRGNSCRWHGAAWFSQLLGSGHKCWKSILCVHRQRDKIRLRFCPFQLLFLRIPPPKMKFDLLLFHIITYIFIELSFVNSDHISIFPCFTKLWECLDSDSSFLDPISI